jgi:hypothetical protein
MAKLTENELERLHQVRKDSLEIASALGELQYQKTVLELLMEDQKQKIKDLKKSEGLLFEELKDKYGNININIETGEFQ